MSAVGEQRFRIVEVTQDRPFISAEVELLEEIGDSPVSEDLISEATDMFGEYARLALGVSGGWVRVTRTPSEPVSLSYHIARSVQMELEDRQRLLERESAERRLEAEIDMLKRSTDSVRRQMVWQFLSRFSRQ